MSSPVTISFVFRYSDWLLRVPLLSELYLSVCLSDDYKHDSCKEAFSDVDES